MRLSFRTKMIVALLFIIIVPITTLGVLSYQEAKTVLIKDLENDNNSVINSSVYFVNKFINEVENNVRFWASDPSMESYFNYDSAGYIARHQWKEFINRNRDIVSMYFGGSDGRFYETPDTSAAIDYNPRQYSWYKNAVGKPGDIFWSEPHRSLKNRETIVTISCAVRDEKNVNQIIGVIGIDYNLNHISIDLQNQSFTVASEGSKLILDRKGNVIVAVNDKLLDRSLHGAEWVKKIMKANDGFMIININGGQYLLNFATIQENGWKVVNMLPMEVIQNVVVPIRNKTIAIAIISSLIAGLAGYLLSRYISKRIKSIINFMEEVEKGNNELLGFYDGDDLFGQLNRKFNMMAININLKMNEIKHMANSDGLTGLYNHKFIFEKLESEIARIKRFEGRLSIIMIDVDYFKSINDSYGHQAGDQALVLVANTIKNNIREIDSVGRYGGEEFLVIMPGCSGEECLIAAERIRKNVENIKWKYKEKKLTISLGIREYNGDEVISLIEAADRMLYKAKEAGRNRIEI